MHQQPRPATSKAAAATTNAAFAPLGAAPLRRPVPTTPRDAASSCASTIPRSAPPLYPRSTDRTLALDARLLNQPPTHATMASTSPRPPFHSQQRAGDETTSRLPLSFAVPPAVQSTTTTMAATAAATSGGLIPRRHEDYQGGSEHYPNDGARPASGPAPPTRTTGSPSRNSRRRRRPIKMSSLEPLDPSCVPLETQALVIGASVANIIKEFRVEGASYDSLAVYAEAAFLETLHATRHLPKPNPLCTAIACHLLDILTNSIAGAARRPFLSQLKLEVFSAVYKLDDAAKERLLRTRRRAPPSASLMSAVVTSTVPSSSLSSSSPRLCHRPTMPPSVSSSVFKDHKRETSATAPPDVLSMHLTPVAAAGSPRHPRVIHSTLAYSLVSSSMNASENVSQRQTACGNHPHGDHTLAHHDAHHDDARPPPHLQPRLFSLRSEPSAAGEERLMGLSDAGASFVVNSRSTGQGIVSPRNMNNASTSMTASYHPDDDGDPDAQRASHHHDVEAIHELLDNNVTFFQAWQNESQLNANLKAQMDAVDIQQAKQQVVLGRIIRRWQLMLVDRLFCAWRSYSKRKDDRLDSMLAPFVTTRRSWVLRCAFLEWRKNAADQATERLIAEMKDEATDMRRSLERATRSSELAVGEHQQSSKALRDAKETIHRLREELDQANSGLALHRLRIVELKQAAARWKARAVELAHCVVLGGRHAKVRSKALRDAWYFVRGPSQHGFTAVPEGGSSTTTRAAASPRLAGTDGGTVPPSRAGSGNNLTLALPPFSSPRNLVSATAVPSESSGISQLLLAKHIASLPDILQREARTFASARAVRCFPAETLLLVWINSLLSESVLWNRLSGATAAGTAGQTDGPLDCPGPSVGGGPQNGALSPTSSTSSAESTSTLTPPPVILRSFVDPGFCDGTVLASIAHALGAVDTPLGNEIVHSLISQQISASDVSSPPAVVGTGAANSGPPHASHQRRASLKRQQQLDIFLQQHAKVTQMREATAGTAADSRGVYHIPLELVLRAFHGIDAALRVKSALQLLTATLDHGGGDDDGPFGLTPADVCAATKPTVLAAYLALVLSHFVDGSIHRFSYDGTSAALVLAAGNMGGASGGILPPMSPSSSSVGTVEQLNRLEADTQHKLADIAAAIGLSYDTSTGTFGHAFRHTTRGDRHGATRGGPVLLLESEDTVDGGGDLLSTGDGDVTTPPAPPNATAAAKVTTTGDENGADAAASSRAAAGGGGGGVDPIAKEGNEMLLLEKALAQKRHAATEWTFVSQRLMSQLGWNSQSLIHSPAGAGALVSQGAEQPRNGFRGGSVATNVDAAEPVNIQVTALAALLNRCVAPLGPKIMQCAGESFDASSSLSSNAAGGALLPTAPAQPSSSLLTLDSTRAPNESTMLAFTSSTSVAAGGTSNSSASSGGRLLDAIVTDVTKQLADELSVVVFEKATRLRQIFASFASSINIAAAGRPPPAATSSSSSSATGGGVGMSHSEFMRSLELNKLVDGKVMPRKVASSLFDVLLNNGGVWPSAAGNSATSKQMRAALSSGGGGLLDASATMASFSPSLSLAANPGGTSLSRTPNSARRKSMVMNTSDFASVSPTPMAAAVVGDVTGGGGGVTAAISLAQWVATLVYIAVAQAVVPLMLITPAFILQARLPPVPAQLRTTAQQKLLSLISNLVPMSGTSAMTEVLAVVYSPPVQAVLAEHNERLLRLFERAAGQDDDPEMSIAEFMVLMKDSHVEDAITSEACRKIFVYFTQQHSGAASTGGHGAAIVYREFLEVVVVLALQCEPLIITPTADRVRSFLRGGGATATGGSSNVSPSVQALSSDGFLGVMAKVAVRKR